MSADAGFRFMSAVDAFYTVRDGRYIEIIIDAAQLASMRLDLHATNFTAPRHSLYLILSLHSDAFERDLLRGVSVPPLIAPRDVTSFAI